MVLAIGKLETKIAVEKKADNRGLAMVISPNSEHETQQEESYHPGQSCA